MLTTRGNHLSNLLISASVTTLLFFALCCLLCGCSTTAKETASNHNSESSKELAPVWQAPVAGMEKKEESSVVIHDMTFTYNKLIASADKNAAKALEEVLAAEKLAAMNAKPAKPAAKITVEKTKVVANSVKEKEPALEKSLAVKPENNKEASKAKQRSVQITRSEKISGEKSTAKSRNTVQISAQAAASQEVYFTIQFLTYDERLNRGSEKLKGIADFKIVPEGRFYKYFTGKTKTFESASDLQYSLREKGFRDAFIVAFKNGNKIPVLDAIRDLSLK